MWFRTFLVICTTVLTAIAVALLALWGGYVTVATKNSSLETIVRYSGVVGVVSLMVAACLVLISRLVIPDKNKHLVPTVQASSPVILPDVQPEVGDKQAIAHLEKLRADVRDEIKKRIKQRDTYSIELTFGLGALLAIALARPDPSFDLGKVLIAAPLISIYFTVLILYSYRIHKLLAGFLRERLEPELARLCRTSPQSEWERYYAEHAVPGIRRLFFLGSLWVITATSLAFLWWAYGQSPDFTLVLIVATVVYTAVTILITLIFWRS
jgi:hypothetical protein